MLVGLYGGTFDPVHTGHIKIAQEAIKQLNLDELWFIPAKIPPHKITSVVASEEDRLKMLQLAINETNEAFKICKYELEKECVSYSYLTLSDFKQIYPDNEFLFIIGEDSLNDFSKWKNPDIISELVQLVVVPRFNSDYQKIMELAEYYKEQYNTKTIILDFSIVNISSTDIRKLISENKDVSEYLSKNVLNYISEKRLYK